MALCDGSLSLENEKVSFWTTCGLPEPVPEYKFHPTRKWRFDFAWIEHHVALEIEGGIWTRGAHVRGKHFLSDMEKYNEAGKLGWRVFRFTPQQYKHGIAHAFLREVIL
jgi:very-short-patch-repair endonuclease